MPCGIICTDELVSKTRRVEIRLTDEDHALLLKRAQKFGGSMTKTMESLLHAIRPADIIGVKPVGKRGRVGFSLRFSNGMVVHGFLWSRGGQLLGPRVFHKDHWYRILDGPRQFWLDVRDLCEEQLLINRDCEQTTPAPRQAPTGECLLNTEQRQALDRLPNDSEWTFSKARQAFGEAAAPDSPAIPAPARQTYEFLINCMQHQSVEKLGKNRYRKVQKGGVAGVDAV